MRLKRTHIAAAFCLVLGSACPAEDNNSDADTGSTVNNNTEDMTTAPDEGNNNPVEDLGNAEDQGGGGGDMAMADLGTGPDADMGASSPWTIRAHSCVGNRTDALWCDDEQTCFVGCGTTTAGNIGLFQTTDGGGNWAAPTTTPAGFFDASRVNSIWRGDAAGPLYVAGDLPNSAGVVEMDAAGALTEVFTRGNQVDNSFTVGKFRRAMNGFAIAESLNGVELVQREADGGDPTDSWASGRGFWSDGDADDVAAGVQILDMEVFNGEFWAVGSTINQPPYVFTPKWTAGDFDFNLVQLASGLAQFDGEMWGIDVSADGVAAGGVDQNRDVGMIYTLDDGADDTDPAAWQAFDVSTVFAGASTWVTDVCRASGDVVYATGRESAEGWGFVLRSTDGGATFEDVTPYDSTGETLFFVEVSRCQAFDDGVIVAGAGGLFARFIAP